MSVRPPHSPIIIPQPNVRANRITYVRRRFNTSFSPFPSPPNVDNHHRVNIDRPEEPILEYIYDHIERHQRQL